MCPEMRMTRFGILVLIILGFTSKAHADITVLLEEPYSYDGALAGTGHTAVYLSRVCASTPVVLRRCKPGERGVVISRYARIGGYDWIATPLIPYLYAVEKPDDIPLYADSKLAAFLRDQYRRSHLEEIAPDGPSGETPKGDWVQLIGSSYDRTSYGFQIETTPEQDDALIAWLNSRPNEASYKVVSRNCANFVRDVVNFYYPKAVSHGFITDLEVTTPKHDAKSLVRYSRHHSDVDMTRIVFPQVPGTMKRSRPVRGVLESVFRAKKYMAPLVMLHPLIFGGIATAYLVGDRFNPAKGDLVFNLNGNPAAPVTNIDRKSYLKNLDSMMDSRNDEDAEHADKSWRQFEESAQVLLDAAGHPILLAPIDEKEVKMGIALDDFVNKNAPADLEIGLLEARLRQQLTKGRAPKISGEQLHQEWQLLEEIDSAGREEVSKRVDRKNQRPGGTSD